LCRSTPFSFLRHWLNEFSRVLAKISSGELLRGIFTGFLLGAARHHPLGRVIHRARAVVCDVTSSLDYRQWDSSSRVLQSTGARWSMIHHQKQGEVFGDFRKRHARYDTIYPPNTRYSAYCATYALYPKRSLGTLFSTLVNGLRVSLKPNFFI